MTRSPKKRGVRLLLRTAGLGLAFAALVVVLLLWLAGTFHRKIDVAARAPVRPAVSEDTLLATVRTLLMPRTEPAVGTVRAVHEASVASKLLAKVLEVRVSAGQSVREGDVLVRLDDADLAARVQQAQAAADRARATRDQARIEGDRIADLFARQSAAKIELDRAQTALKEADAHLEEAEQALEESRTILGYATIHAPLSGAIIDKRVEAGDTVTPGQVLLTLYDPTRMQLVAAVRESLTRRLSIGQSIGVRLDALQRTCQGRVSEIVPEAQAATRTFLVKVTGPCPPGIYSGMFGRLLIPLEEESLLVVPQAAVRRIGQLTMVDVAEVGVRKRRAVQLGRPVGDDVEVLSGLAEGERVVLNSGVGQPAEPTP